MRTRLASCLTSVVLLLLSSAALPAQQTAPAFRAEANLVLVPVVVRDAKGEAVANLTKADFRLFDNGKEQAIASFSVEETTGQVAPDRSQPDAGAAPANEGAAAAQPKAAAMVIPEHYVALLFDDQHFKLPAKGGDTPVGYIGDAGDLWFARDAARKMIKTLKPVDRIGVFTSSGDVMLDFTADRAKIEEALLKLRPGKSVLPTVANSGLREREVEEQTEQTVTWCGDVVRRMSRLPGQRTLVFISPGLMLSGAASGAWSALGSTMNLIDHAIRSRVVINSLDARGLWAAPPSANGQIKAVSPFTEFQQRVTDGTGGRYIRDTNDLNGAMERLAETPKYIYVLGFSPENIRRDGSFHHLSVKLAEDRKFDVQARAGYYDGDVPAEKSQERALTAKAEAPQYNETETRELAKSLEILPAAPAPVTVPAAAPKNDEITTTEQPAIFKVQANLVEVPVIVRDHAGKAVGYLKQEDFHILDKGKKQEITKFAVVKAAGSSEPAAETRAEAPALSAPAPGVSSTLFAGSAAPPAVPTRFVAFVFDDLHMLTADLPQVRGAVVKYVSTSLGPRDRAALFTTSGQQGVDFTDRPDALIASLNKITPSPITEPDLGGCGDAHVSFFQAVQVDRQVGLEPLASDVSKCLALRVAVAEFKDFRTAVNAIRDAYTSGLQESRATLAALRAVVQRMAAMPGQRSVLLVSPGFFVPSDVQNESDALMAMAIRSKVLISSVDARGVWTNPVFSACKKDGLDAAAIRDETAFKDLEGQANTDALIALAEDTGGTVNLNNDFFGGVQKAAAAPDYMYVLGFVPQDLKLDGSFHALKVTVGSGEKLSLQARRGYWAPKHAEDEAAVSKQEIEEAVFSRDEVHGLPVDMHTRWTKLGEQAKLTVLTSVDLKSIQLRKAQDRNRNDLTIVASVFDSNGNFLVGTQKLLRLRLRDETVAGLRQKPPIVIDTDFDLKPGSYLVRLVVRDAEGQQITAENAAVQVQ